VLVGSFVSLADISRMMMMMMMMAGGGVDERV
jgi:hypothetical protein